MEQTYQQNARVFKAFCDERRLRILELLQEGEACACALGEQLALAQSTLSYHMKILCESGIVANRQEGKWTHYKISESGTHFAGELLKKMTTLKTVAIKDNCCKK